MSEEDIIDIIKNLSIDEYEWYLDSNKYQGHNEEISKIVTEAIQGLLELYQQEKEKNSYLEKQNENTAKLLHIALNTKDNLISKDKIKEKLEELKDKEQELTDEQGYWGGTALQEKIELLEELLEE